MKNTTPHTNLPWWKHGFVWLVISGPLVVVVASFVTLYLASSRPNEIVTEATQPHRQQSSVSPSDQAEASGNAPAMLGRNHATTGVVPPAK